MPNWKRRIIRAVGQLSDNSDEDGDSESVGSNHAVVGTAASSGVAGVAANGTQPGTSSSSDTKLFVDENTGSALLFWIIDSKMRADLKERIEYHGGRVLKGYRKSAIVIADASRHGAAQRGSYYRKEFILDSIRARRLQATDLYKIVPLSLVSRNGADGVASASASAGGAGGAGGGGTADGTSSNGKRGGRSSYTNHEDGLILLYVSNSALRPGGAVMFKNMEAQKIVDRSWQSIKERYKKRLCKYSTNMQQMLMRKAQERMNREVPKLKLVRASSPDHKSSAAASSSSRKRKTPSNPTKHALTSEDLARRSMPPPPRVLHPRAADMKKPQLTLKNQDGKVMSGDHDVGDDGGCGGDDDDDDDDDDLDEALLEPIYSRPPRKQRRLDPMLTAAQAVVNAGKAHISQDPILSMPSIGSSSSSCDINDEKVVVAEQQYDGGASAASSQPVSGGDASPAENSSFSVSMTQDSDLPLGGSQMEVDPKRMAAVQAAILMLQHDTGASLAVVHHALIANNGSVDKARTYLTLGKGLTEHGNRWRQAGLTPWSYADSIILQGSDESAIRAVFRRRGNPASAERVHFLSCLNKE
jgi:Rap1 Myb domain/BRCT domain, a BRCA1 C-terminus domain